MKGILTVLSGFSGVGKGTVVARMKEKHEFTLSISATTRAPRTGEADGVSYYFITQEEFDRRVAEDQFLEWARYTKGSYGTPKQPVLEALERGEDVLLEIESQGAYQIKKQYPEALLIFMLPPSFKELESRLRNRGTETDDQIRDRLNKTLEEIPRIKGYDQIVINHEVDKTADEVLQLIDMRRKSPDAMEDFIEQIHQEAEEALNAK